MFFEEKPRRTGKTTRLVEGITSFLSLNLDKVALIVAPTNEQRLKIRDMVHTKCGDFCSKRTITSHKMFEKTESMKQFVDEVNLMKQNRLTLDNEAYYTTTPCITPLCYRIKSLYEQVKTQKVEPNKFIKKHEL